MDSSGSLIDTNLRIFPSKNLLDYLNTLPIDDNVPINIARLVKGKTYEAKHKVPKEDERKIPVHLDSKDIENLNKIKAILKIDDKIEEEKEKDVKEGSKEQSKDKDTKNEGSDSVKPNEKSKNNLDKEENTEKEDELHLTTADIDDKTEEGNDKIEEEKEKDVNEGSEEKSKDKDTKNEGSDSEKPNEKSKNNHDKDENTEKEDELHLTTTDIDWLYTHLQQKREANGDGDKNVPYLHVLLEGAHIETPENKVIKRDPVLEARCVKLRAQQQARDYRKMTKSVDNVRMRFPEDSISYQLKQMNRQLIAIGQFIISIFAGFLFGFRGIEWMVGNLDFGFRLLLGVMCALVIALAEIYFLAKKLNEELNIPETIQLGGPPKFADQPNQHDYVPKVSSKAIDKEHQD